MVAAGLPLKLLLEIVCEENGTLLVRTQGDPVLHTQLRSELRAQLPNQLRWSGQAGLMTPSLVLC